MTVSPLLSSHPPPILTQRHSVAGYGTSGQAAVGDYSNGIRDWSGAEGSRATTANNPVGASKNKVGGKAAVTKPQSDPKVHNTRAKAGGAASSAASTSKAPAAAKPAAAAAGSAKPPPKKLGPAKGAAGSGAAPKKPAAPAPAKGTGAGVKKAPPKPAAAGKAADEGKGKAPAAAPVKKQAPVKK